MIELLESRIAPAGIIAINLNNKTASWTDFDGDLVTLKWTTGEPSFKASAPVVTNDSRAVQVNEIDLNQTADANDAITVSVKAGPMGDGHVDLGYVNATGVPLKSFIAPSASILEFDAGDGTHAVGTLTVASYGTISPDVFPGNGQGLTSGTVGTINIRGDLVYGSLQLGNNSASIGTVTVGGSLNGKPGDGSAGGGLFLLGPVNSVTIGHSLIGGTQLDSGTLLIESSLKTALHIGGNIIGGSNQLSGKVEISGASPSAVITVGGSILGGSVNDSGNLDANSVKSITVGGDLRGGSAGGTGLIAVNSAQTITIKGSVFGGNIATSNTNAVGSVLVSGNLGSLVIDRDLVAGVYGSSGQNAPNGGIYVSGDLGSLTIHGSVQGDKFFRAIITVTGTTPTKAGNFNAIGKVTIGGSFEFGILDSGAGEGTTSNSDLGMAINPDSGIGSVTIGGDFLHSSILAGTNDLDTIGAGRATANTEFDTQSIGDISRHAVLGSVTIKGAIQDDFHSTGESGFEAETITKIIVDGHQVYKSGQGFKNLDPTGGVFAVEFPIG